MTRARTLALVAALAAGLTVACAPPESTPPPGHDEAPVTVLAPKLVRIDNTPEAIADCMSDPGGFPEWHIEVVDGQVVRFLACRIVS